MDKRISDGVHWKRVSRIDADRLEARGLIAVCTGPGCPTGTYHPIGSWAEIETALLRDRLA